MALIARETWKDKWLPINEKDQLQANNHLLSQMISNKSITFDISVHEPIVMCEFQTLECILQKDKACLLRDDGPTASFFLVVNKIWYCSRWKKDLSFIIILIIMIMMATTLPTEMEWKWLLCVISVRPFNEQIPWSMIQITDDIKMWYSRTSIIRTSIIRTFRLSGLFLWSRFFMNINKLWSQKLSEVKNVQNQEKCVQNSAFTASLSKDLALGDKEHPDAFSWILIGSVL